MGSYLIFISPLIAWHNYNLGLKKGFGINWINLAAISCACMLILSAPPLEKNLIKYTNNTFKPDRIASWEKRGLKLNGIKTLLFQISMQVWGKSQPTQDLMTTGLKSGLADSLYLPILSPHIWIFLYSLCLSFSFFSLFDCSNTNTQHVWGCWSSPLLRSSNMQVGSQMIKAMAGGFHFETINRPPRAESNSKPTIPVSPGSWWHRGRGHAEGERADSTVFSVFSLYSVEKPWSSYGGIPASHSCSDVISSRLCGLIQLILQPLTRWGRRGWAVLCSIFAVHLSIHFLLRLCKATICNFRTQVSRSMRSKINSLRASKPYIHGQTGGVS